MTNNQTRTRTAEEIEASIRFQLEYHVESANQARADFAAKLTEDKPLHETLHAFTWSRETVLTVAVGSLAAAVLQDCEEFGVPLVEALRTSLKRVQSALMNNQFPGSSTSHFSNATEHTVRQAYSQFYDRFGNYAA